MTNEELVRVIRDRARGNFSKGFNCAECVVEAVLESMDTGLPRACLKMATGFGGGIGLYGDTCGAVAGAVMAVSAVHGREHLPVSEDRQKALAKGKEQLYGRPGLYRLFNQIPNLIANRYGTTLCREVTAPWHDQWLCREHALHCRELISDAAEVAARLALGKTDELAMADFGSNVENLKETTTKEETR